MKVAAPIWGAVPVALLSEKITLNMLKVYVALASFQGSNEKAWPTREEVAERANLGEDKVSKAITKLVEAGWILRVRRPQEHKSNVYRVLFSVEPDDIVDPKVADSDTSESGGNSHPESGGNSHFPLYRKEQRKEQYKKLIEQEQDQDKIDSIRRVIGYFNKVMGTNLKSTTDSNFSVIQRVIEDGYTEDQLRLIIDSVASEWPGTKYEPWMKKLSTVFGPTKMEARVVFADEWKKKQETKPAPIPQSRLEDLPFYYEVAE